MSFALFLAQLNSSTFWDLVYSILSPEWNAEKTCVTRFLLTAVARLSRESICWSLWSMLIWSARIHKYYSTLMPRCYV
jgi:hypothetical protein